MGERKHKPKAPPRQVGEFLVSEAVVERRQWEKRPPVDAASCSSDGSNQGQLFEDSAGQPAPADRERATPSEPRAAAAGGGSLFQYNGQYCDESNGQDFAVETDRVLSPEDVGEVVGREYRVRPCRCRKWFCDYCGPRQGKRLQQKLLARLATFTNVYGLTLTLDGELFAGPEQAWLYVMENRLLSRLMRDLEDRGHLHSKAYFWVVEFQKFTEQPHWHLLLDAKFVPYGEIVEIWSRFRPPDASPLPEKITAENYQGQAPAFGSVRFTPAETPEQAGFYATKYLTKYPKHGYPAWVLNRTLLRRYGTSKLFFPRVPGHDPMCFCDECRGDVGPEPIRKPPTKPGQSKRARRPRKLSTIRQRLEQCGNRCTIVQVQRVQLPDGTIVDGRSRFDAALNLPFRTACELLGKSADDLYQLELTGEEATALEEYARQFDDEGEAA